MTRVAIIGATGAVGRRMLEELEYYGIECQVSLFASERSAGQTLKFRGETVRVEAFALEKLTGINYVLMSAGGAFSREYGRALAGSGRTVIDNSSAWRMADGVPLIVPEVNFHDLGAFSSGIIANPNCSTIQLVVALQPLHKAFQLTEVSVATYQSVSGTGQKGIEELNRQITASARGDEIRPEVYARPIFNNLIPAIDVMREGGHCYEEEKMIRETRKIMNIPTLAVHAATVRVPVLYCHSEAVTVRLGREVTRQEVLNVLGDAEGIHLRLEDDYEFFPYPNEVAGRRDVWVGRVRLPLDQSKSRVVQFWNVADNLNKGAATNAVQILKRLWAQRVGN